MKKSRFSEEKIIQVLKAAESGVPVDELTRQHGFSRATFYTWRRKYGGLEVDEAKRLKALEDENSRLKRLVADLTFDKQILQDVTVKKMVKPAARRKASSHLRETYSVSGRRAARVMCLHRSTMRYKPSKRSDDDVRQRLRELAVDYPRYGYQMLTDKLSTPERPVNHKRVYRLYREESLQLPKRRRKRIRSEKRSPLVPAERINQRWSMDFIHDMLATGRRFRALAVLDICPRESLAIEPDFSIPGLRVTRVLDTIVAERGAPEEIVVDNDPEFRSRELDGWASRHGVRLHFIESGKPTQNAFIESFNRTFRGECLDLNWFIDMEDAKTKIEFWRREYNEHRPHSSLDRTPPSVFARRAEAFVQVSMGQ